MGANDCEPLWSIRTVAQREPERVTRNLGRRQPDGPAVRTCGLAFARIGGRPLACHRVRAGCGAGGCWQKRTQGIANARGESRRDFLEAAVEITMFLDMMHDHRIDHSAGVGGERVLRQQDFPERARILRLPLLDRRDEIVVFDQSCLEPLEGKQQVTRSSCIMAHVSGSHVKGQRSGNPIPASGVA